jgi:hypothetical protein
MAPTATFHVQVGSTGDADRAMAKLRHGGKFVTIAGSTALHPKPGVAQSAIHNCEPLLPTRTRFCLVDGLQLLEWTVNVVA